VRRRQAEPIHSLEFLFLKQRLWTLGLENPDNEDQQKKSAEHFVRPKLAAMIPVSSRLRGQHDEAPLDQATSPWSSGRP